MDLEPLFSCKTFIVDPCRTTTATNTLYGLVVDIQKNGHRPNYAQTKFVEIDPKPPDHIIFFHEL